MVEMSAANSLSVRFFGASALLVLLSCYSVVKMLSLLSHLHLVTAMHLHFFPKPASLSAPSASNQQLRSSEEGAGEGNQHLCSKWSCWVSRPALHESSVKAEPGQSTATSSPRFGWSCWALNEGINSSSNSFAFCHSLTSWLLHQLQLLQFSQMLQCLILKISWPRKRFFQMTT